MASKPTAHSLIIGNPFGAVFPPSSVDIAKLPKEDGRTHALRVLALYISELTFYRPGDVDGEPLPFRIPLERIHIEAPDNDVDMVLPCIVFSQEADEEYEQIGLTINLDESTIDKYAPRTVLQIQYDQTETFVIEVWSSKKPERRAIIAGLQTALTPTEYMYGIRFRMPDYFDQPVVFTPVKHRRPDDQAIKGRRIGKLSVEMRFEVVCLVNYVPLLPVVEMTFTDDGAPVPQTGLRASHNCR